MIVRLLEDYNGLERGTIKKYPDHLAYVLVARGIAVREKEKAVDREANQALDEAKERDEKHN